MHACFVVQVPFSHFYDLHPFLHTFFFIVEKLQYKVKKENKTVKNSLFQLLFEGGWPISAFNINSFSFLLFLSVKNTYFGCQPLKVGSSFN